MALNDDASQAHPPPSRQPLQPSPDAWSHLPDNVLSRIFETLSSTSITDLCNVSRLNRRYHALADAVLYQRVHFVTPDLHLLFSESLRRRPRRGSIIREVKLTYPAHGLSQEMLDAPVHGSHYDSALVRYDSMSRTISMMSNLEALEIAVPVALLSGIGKLFDGPFDLACLRECTLFYQREDGDYWDLQENIYIFAHPALETLTIKRAKLDEKGFESIELPHETPLARLHLIECDINDDALSDILMFPKALEEFVLTQTTDPSPDLEESSDRIEDYILALKSACHSLTSITIDFPSLAGPRPLRMRDFETLKTLRINWDYQLFGASSSKPRLNMAGLPPELETLEFFNPFGTDEEVTELFVYLIENVNINSELLRIAVDQGEDSEVPSQVRVACKKQPRVQLDIIGSFDSGDDIADDLENGVDGESQDDA